MIDRIMDIYRSVERWVHRTEESMRFPVLTGIGHGVILAVGMQLFGLPIGFGMLAAGVGAVSVQVMLAILLVIGVTLYGAREERNRREKGTRQAARDGDTLFGPDFILAVVGGVAGHTIARAILGV